MMFFRMFGIGTDAAIAGGKTEGTVTAVKTCWWFKVNTKPVRRHAGDGAAFPHIIHFDYQVAGRSFTGKRWVSWDRRCPVVGERVTVHYEEGAPERSAVIV